MSATFNIWGAIFAIVFGGAGWLITSFFAKPLLDFLQLRREVHEEIIMAANLGSVSENAEIVDERKALRRLAARVEATAVTAPRLLRTFLARRGYDLTKAAGGLIGVSNSLTANDGARALHKNRAQTGLQLPREYTDQEIMEIAARIGQP
jgi:hypothetical protein